jgi:hypothetical protein
MPAQGPAWDASEEVSDSGAAVIRAFQSDPGTVTFRAVPANLDSTAVYEVRSVDSGIFGRATGAEIMADGIDLTMSPTSAAHLIVLMPMGSAPAEGLRRRY